ncbi:hypothetical protein Tco_1420880 [Tanacetum coccineum]
MIVALETADRTSRPTFDFTRKIFANMKFKWEGQPIPLTTPMLDIAAAGNDAADGDDDANEDNAAANKAAGSATEAHLAPHSPPVSPVREPTPKRQPVSERPPSPSPSIPETAWVVPNPVSPVTDWRPWLWTLIISFPSTHGGFHVESPVRPDDAPTPTADAAGRAEDPALLTDGYPYWHLPALGHDQPAGPSEDVEEREEEDYLSAGPSAAAIRGTAHMPDLDKPSEFLA